MPLNFVTALREVLISNLTGAVDKALAEVFSLDGGSSAAAMPKRGPGRPPGSSSKKTRQKAEVTRWVPNRQARRVPHFVQKLTGFALMSTSGLFDGLASTLVDGFPVSRSRVP